MCAACWRDHECSWLSALCLLHHGCNTTAVTPRSFRAQERKREIPARERFPPERDSRQREISDNRERQREIVAIHQGLPRAFLLMAARRAEPLAAV
jgi:hypothetical protein